MDADLYAYATDFSDLEHILAAPLPSEHAMALRAAERRKGASPAFAASSPPPPPPSLSASDGSDTIVFRRIAEDARTGIEVFSSPVEGCPIHLMRATGIIPCRASELLLYMENDVRPEWDGYVKLSRHVRPLSAPPSDAAAAAARSTLSTSLAVHYDDHKPPRPTSLRVTSQDVISVPASSSSHPPPPSSTGAATLSRGRTGGEEEKEEDDGSTKLASFTYQPGQRRVALHHLGIRSPVPFVQDRDFELVVAEEIRPDGVAYMKAFSTPMGYVVPLDPAQTRYVRAALYLSGVIAHPLDLHGRTVAERNAILPQSLRGGTAASASSPVALGGGEGGAARSKKGRQAVLGGPGAPREYCVIDYFGLVHPMGLVPPMLVNMIISAQITTLKKLQQYVLENPPHSLPAAVSRGGLGGEQRGGRRRARRSGGPSPAMEMLRDTIGVEDDDAVSSTSTPNLSSPLPSPTVAGEEAATKSARGGTGTASASAQPPSPTSQEAGKKEKKTRDNDTLGTNDATAATTARGQQAKGRENKANTEKEEVTQSWWRRATRTVWSKL